jgi:hypothetical protein
MRNLLTTREDASEALLLTSGPYRVCRVLTGRETTYVARINAADIRCGKKRI